MTKTTKGQAQVKPVRTPRERKQFLDLPYKLYRNE